MAYTDKETLGAINVDIPDIVEDVDIVPCVLYRVPVQVRRGKEHIYEPEVVPLGPYHHKGHPQLQLVEPLKNELRDIVCTDANHKSFFMSKIRERINDIRHFYGGADGYDDEELSEMMLRDACFLICYMQRNDAYLLIRRRLGMSGELFMYCDTYMLENQIPLWLIDLIHPHQSLLCEFLSYENFGDDRMTQLPWSNGGGGEEPLHLLEASRRTSLSLDEAQENPSNFFRLFSKYNKSSRKQSSRTMWQTTNSQFRSATDLKAKGIHFQRSSYSLTDIKFFSFAFYAQLRLPFFYVTSDTKVVFSNIIAFEMSPETHTDFEVTSYFNFMKTLVDDVKDVKVLREKGIVYSTLASDEDVVGLFKSIDTYGFPNNGIFSDVTMRIEEHCNDKGRTWMADLVNTYFRSPWTVIALAAAALLICLTIVQTYFTINPRS